VVANRTYHQLAFRDGDRVIGYVTTSVAVAAILAIGFSTPWPVRLCLVTIALLLGPAVPVLRLVFDMPTFECLALGVVVDVALLMVLGAGMAYAKFWAPVWCAVALLSATIAAGITVAIRSGGGDPRSR
jgi:hypothetical protein